MSAAGAAPLPDEGEPGDEARHGGADVTAGVPVDADGFPIEPGYVEAAPGAGLGVWSRLEERFGLVSLRPRLADDVRIRQIGDEHELVQISTRTVLQLDEEDVRVVRAFDGSRTIAELIVGDIGSEGVLAVEPILSLVDRLVRADLLASHPPDLYRQVESYLADVAVADVHPVGPAIADGAGDPGGPPVQAQLPWRPRTPLLAERARFLRGVSLFASLDLRSIGALAEVLTEETFPAASNIVEYGAIADRFYVVRSGEVNVVQHDDDGERRRIARLGAGDWFGEAGLLETAPRNATVRAGTSRPVQLYGFDAGTFERIISPHIASFRGRQLVSRRRERLANVPLFRALADEDLDRLSQRMRERRAPKGTVLVRQGEDADEFYVVAEGAVGVLRDGTPVARLGEGEFFGETALLFTEQRTATVATLEDSLLWVLDREAFTTFVRDALLQRRDMMPTVMGRLSNQRGQ